MNKNSRQEKLTSRKEKIIWRMLKVAKASFTSQFNLSKMLVATVLIVIALLGPIIQLSIRDLEVQQQQKLATLSTRLVENGFPPIKTSTELNALIDQVKLNPSLFAGRGITVQFLKSYTIEGLSYAVLGQVFSTSILYAMGYGIFSALKDKNSMDKNRVMYMNFSKHKILFFKLLSEAMLFMFIVISADIIGILLVKEVGKGIISKEQIQQLCIQLVGIFFLYLFVQVGIRYITSKIQSKVWKGVSLAIWLLSTAFLYIILSIVLGVKLELNDVIIENKYVFAFLPIINIVILPLVLYGFLPLWTITPFIIYIVIAISCIWKPLTGYVKDYLCS